MYQVAPRRPPFLSFIASALGLLPVALALVFLTAVLSSGPYLINGEPSAKGEYLRAILPMLAAAIPAGIISYGLWKHHPWTRPSVLVFFAFQGVGAWVISLFVPAPEGVGFSAITYTVTVPLPLAWYLYRKANVVEYYEVLVRSRA